MTKTVHPKFQINFRAGDGTEEVPSIGLWRGWLRCWLAKMLGSESPTAKQSIFQKLLHPQCAEPETAKQGGESGSLPRLPALT